MDPIFELRTQKSEDDLLHYEERQMDMAEAYQQREADIKLNGEQLLKSKENTANKAAKLTADMPADDTAEKKSKKKKKKKAKLLAEQAKSAEEQTAQQMENGIIAASVMDEKAADELCLAKKAEFLQSTREFQEGMQEQERYAFIHSEHLSYEAQYEELAALKEQLERAKTEQSEPYQKYGTALMEMYQEFFTLQELCGKYNIEATATGALLLEQDETRPQNIQNALLAMQDKQDEKMQLIKHRADCIKAGILNILEEKPMTDEQASIVREYVQADHRDQFIQGNVGTLIEKERAQRAADKQLLEDGAANGYADLKPMLLADLKKIRDLDMQSLESCSTAELIERAEELQTLALAGSFAGEVTKYLDAQAGAERSTIDIVADGKKEEFSLKWKLLWAHAGRAKTLSMIQAYARGSLTQEHFSEEEQSAIREKCGLREEDAITGRDMLIYLKERLQIYEAQIPAAYNAYFKTKEAKNTFAEHKKARKEQAFIFPDFEHELDHKKKAVCAILNISDLKSWKVQGFYNEQKEMLQQLKEQRQDNAETDDKIKNWEKTLDYIEIAHALMGNKYYTLAGEKKELIKEPILRTINAVGGMQGVAEMGEAGYIEMCRKLAAGALSGQTATPEELAAYRKENRQGLAEYKKLMKLQYEALENRFHHKAPSVEYIVEHSAELNHIFGNAQVDNNLVLHSNEIIDIHNEEDMRLFHLVQVYHAMASYVNLVYNFCYDGQDYQTAHKLAAKLMEEDVRYSFEYLDRSERGMTEAEKHKQETELDELEKFRTAYIRMAHTDNNPKEENFQSLLMLEELDQYLEAHKDDTTPEIKMMRDMYHIASRDKEKEKDAWVRETNRQLKIQTNMDGFMLLYARYKAKAQPQQGILPLAEKLATLRVTPDMLSGEYIGQHSEELLASFEAIDAYERMLEEDQALRETIPADQRLAWEKNKKLYEQYRTYVNAYARSCCVDLESGEYLTKDTYLAEKDTFAGNLSEAKEQLLPKLKFSNGFESHAAQLADLSAQLEKEGSLTKELKAEALKALSDARIWLTDMDAYLKAPVEVMPEEFFDAKLMTFMSMFGYMERGLREAKEALAKSQKTAGSDRIFSELSEFSDSFQSFRQRIPGQAKELRNAIMESGQEKRLSLQDVVSYAQEVKTFTRDAQTRSVGGGTSEVLKFKEGEQLYFFKEDEKLQSFQESAEETLVLLQEDEIAGCFKKLIENAAETGVIDNDNMNSVANVAVKLFDEAGNLRDEQVTKLNHYLGSQNLQQYLMDEQNWEKWKRFAAALKKSFETARQVQDVGLQLDAGADMTARNYATERVAELLGVKDLIVRNQKAVVLEADGTVKKGFVMDGAQGKMAGAFKDEAKEKSKQGYHIYVEEKAQKQLLNLQILDNITGQKDRNTGNYFLVYDVDDAKKTITVKQVTGIDNDFAFGRAERIQFAPSQVYRKTADGYRFILEMMDKELYESMMAVSPELLAANMEGLIEPEYIKALTVRYEILRNSIKEAAQTKEDFFREKGKWGVASQNKAVMGEVYGTFLAQLLPREEQPERPAEE